jgi:hypothetical protein
MATAVASTRFRCTKCDKVFDTAHGLLTHERIAHKTTFRCTEPGCTEEFPTQQGLRTHRTRIHAAVATNGKHAPAPYSCKVCGERFGNRWEVAQHHRWKHPKPAAQEYKCSVCDFKTTVKKSYANHMRNQHGVQRKQKQAKQPAAPEAQVHCCPQCQCMYVIIRDGSAPAIDLTRRAVGVALQVGGSHAR